MQDQSTPVICAGCAGECCDCDGGVEWSGRGRRKTFCCTRCKDRAKSAVHRAKIAAAGATCAFPGCDNIRRTATPGGLCSMHYKRQRLGEDMNRPKQRVSRHEHRPCAVEGCTRRLSAKGLCALHYNRLGRTGDVGPAGLTQLAPGTRTRWVDARNGYVYTYVVGEGKGQLEHRVLMEGLIGRPLRKGETVHHRNGERADNRIENLELWVTTHPSGQRVADLIAFVSDNYTDANCAYLAEHHSEAVKAALT